MVCFAVSTNALWSARQNEAFGHMNSASVTRIVSRIMLSAPAAVARTAVNVAAARESSRSVTAAPGGAHVVHPRPGPGHDQLAGSPVRSGRPDQGSRATRVSTGFSEARLDRA